MYFASDEGFLMCRVDEGRETTIDLLKSFVTEEVQHPALSILLRLTLHGSGPMNISPRTEYTAEFSHCFLELERNISIRISLVCFR